MLLVDGVSDEQARVRKRVDGGWHGRLVVCSTSMANWQASSQRGESEENLMGCPIRRCVVPRCMYPFHTLLLEACCSYISLSS